MMLPKKVINVMNVIKILAWIESVSVSIVANNGESNLGNGVIFYHSNSETFFNKYSMCEKINLPQSMRGIKGIWKLKSQK